VSADGYLRALALRKAGRPAKGIVSTVEQEKRDSWPRGRDHGGGRHVRPRPYTKSSLNQDFRDARVLAFGKGEEWWLQDMRRSGAVEGDAGGGSVEDQSKKMANTVAVNNRLRKTYKPVNTASAPAASTKPARRVPKC
jgi:hypothetical protein